MITDGRVARWLVLALDEGVEMAGCGRGGKERRATPPTINKKRPRVGVLRPISTGS